MMTHYQPLHVSGSKVAPDAQIEDSSVKNAIQHLKYELATKQTESKKLTDQLNCLISLIKRSWTGDKHATLHLSNIVGMEPPEYFDINHERVNHPSSQAGHTSPLAKKEIREYQQQYIENRQAYMDAVLQDHQQIMSRIPLHHKSEPAAAVTEMDSKFLQYGKVMQRTESSAGGNFRRVQSAGQQRKVPDNDKAETMDVPLWDLTLNETLTQSANVYRRPLSSAPSRQLPPNTYNDPGRYTQSNLFTLNESDGVKRPRPVSSSSLKAGDIIRSRPQSRRNVNKNNRGNQTGKPVFTEQKHERPLKYETTRPVSSKLKSAHHRGHSANRSNNRAAGEARPVLLTDVISASSKAVVVNGNGGDLSSRNEHFNGDRGSEDVAFHSEKSYEERQSFHDVISAKPPSAVRVKSAFQRRPAFIDEFAKDEQALRDIQDDFRRTALGLQKKLGIADSGMVI